MARGDKFLDVLASIEVIESTSLAQRVLNRFPSGVKTQIAQALRKLPLVIFTSSIDDLLRFSDYQKVAATSITGTGNFFPARVPAGKRWKLIGIHAIKATGTWTLDAVMIQRPDTSDNMTFEKHTSGIEISTLLEGARPTLEENWWLGVRCDGYTGTGDMVFRVFYEEENMY